MKKVIAGKLYDTDRAQVIHNWSNGSDRGNFHTMEETLYKTKSGAFFVWGEGHGLTKWASHSDCGRMSGWGSDVVALNEAEALKWCEEHECPAETIQVHFKVQEA